jgi:hypothetical protein
MIGGSDALAGVAIILGGAVHVDFHATFDFAGFGFRPGHDKSSFGQDV